MHPKYYGAYMGLALILFGVVSVFSYSFLTAQPYFQSTSLENVASGAEIGGARPAAPLATTTAESDQAAIDVSELAVTTTTQPKTALTITTSPPSELAPSTTQGTPAMQAMPPPSTIESPVTTTVQNATTEREQPMGMPPPQEPVDRTTTTSGTLATTATVAVTEPLPTGRQLEQQVVELTNKARVEAGCRPVTNNDLLHRAALGHSTDMNTNDYFSHLGLDGSDPSERVSARGYRATTMGENIALGYQSAEAVVAGWMNSPGHRANLLNCDFQEIGVGFDNYYWTQNFGTSY